MVRGLNETVPYAGLKFHVQTEQATFGGEPQIVTHIFFGGTVVSTRRTSLDSTGSKRKTEVRAAVKRHHRELIRELTTGHFDDRIADTPGTREARRVEGRPSSQGDGNGVSSDAAADHFSRGVELLAQVLELWRTAERLAPERPSYRAAVALMSKLVSSVSSGARRPTAAIDTLSQPDSGEPASTPSGTGTFSASHYQAAELYEQGLQAIQRRDLHRAATLLSKAAALDPDNARYAAALKKVRRLQGAGASTSSR